VPTTVYGIVNCDTVKRARAWLSEQGVDFMFHDFKKSGVPPARLDAWIAALGWERLLNVKGTTWRKLPPSLRDGVIDAATARALILEQPSVVKRPVIDWDATTVTVGFDPALWAQRRQVRPP
jgi:arsenate reductase